MDNLPNRLVIYLVGFASIFVILFGIRASGTSLLVWGFLLGGIGAILAVPMTLLVLIIMENFEGTRTVAILMRYPGEEKKEERKEAAKHV
jgi:hypothetical protein